MSLWHNQRLVGGAPFNVVIFDHMTRGANQTTNQLTQ